ncbi:MAG: hypothetical protein EPO68_07160 [Planctomycetota bacterium]|nr:MAG: hypothetical protein EPO68_07160 [Planctomycetota bacterium]
MNASKLWPWIALLALCGCASAPHEHTSLLSRSRVAEVRPQRLVLEIVQSERSGTNAPANALYEAAAAELTARGYSVVEGGTASADLFVGSKSLSGESQGCPCTVARENFFVRQQAREVAALLQSLGADALWRLTLTEAARGEAPERVYVSARAELLAAADPGGLPIWSAYLTRAVAGSNARELSSAAAAEFGRAAAAALPASTR